MPTTPPERYLTLDEVAERLELPRDEAYAVVRSGGLRAIYAPQSYGCLVERSWLETYLMRRRDQE